MTSLRTVEKLAETRFLLDSQDAHSADSIAYVHTVLSQIGLPRSPQKIREWERCNGGAALSLTAGKIYSRDESKWLPQPLPQGPYARLILADISSYAVRYRTPVVPMEASVSAYMRDRLHLFPGGGKRGTYTSFKREAQALACVHMELAYMTTGQRQRQVKAPPIRSFDAWVVNDGPQQALWPCELILSDAFYGSLRAHALPIDMRAYRGLGHSALAQDIYTWLSHRLHRLKEPLELSWSVLADQFGGYSDVKNFRQDFIARLKEVRQVYRGARVSVVIGSRGETGGGLLLEPSSPPVPRTSKVVPASIERSPGRGPIAPRRQVLLPPNSVD
jgi:Plasmid encoded RepA protein